MPPSLSPTPIIFVGHGSPMNAITANPWRVAWGEIGAQFGSSATARWPRPKAIVVISAHWHVKGTRVTRTAAPPTIHDFSGFPPALYEIQYPAAGAPELAAQIATLLGPTAPTAALDEAWGLDHGAWSVLMHMFPHADLPVVQLSMDTNLSPTEHVGIGRALRTLRREQVLILASGNLTHNLRHAIGQMNRANPETPTWAAAFDRDVAAAMARHDLDFLRQAIGTEHGRLAHPSPEHYLPLLYAAGASEEADTIEFPCQGFDLGSLSMRCALWRP